MSKWSLNKEKTLELFLEKVRKARVTKLSELDVEFLRALETDDASAKSSVITQKTNLRDLHLHLQHHHFLHHKNYTTNGLLVV